MVSNCKGRNLICRRRVVVRLSLREVLRGYDNNLKISRTGRGKKWQATARFSAILERFPSVTGSR